MSHRPRYVLGTGLSHDGSACLLKDGEMCVAIEKERITRRKHDGLNDMAAIRYCLDAEGIRLDDLELIVQNANFQVFQYGHQWFHGSRDLPASVPVVTITHHLAHAYSAFYASPFEDAATLVIDGCGNAYDDCPNDGAIVPETPPAVAAHLYFEKDSFYGLRDGRLAPLFKDFSPWGLRLREYPMHPNTTKHSIGGLYMAASLYAFDSFDDAGKLMGLAPYGRPGVYDFPIFDLVDGRVFVRYDWMHRFDRPARTKRLFKEHFQYYADIAWWVQREVERAILYVVRSRRELYSSDNLCYAGGVALNAVANRRLIEESGYRRVFIQPAAGDNGLALGCAYYGWIEVLRQERRHHTGSTALGRSYAGPSSDRAVEEFAADGRIEMERPADYIARVADLLADGRVVGWFQGRAEFGPRALGHRSILADPRRLPMRDFINREIKCREDFRPFAPSVLEEDRAIYFEGEADSPYMLLVAPVRPEWRERIPAVVHEDGSARIQTVSRAMNPEYDALLRAFKARTGIGVLLNTSLNRRAMPIVETPAEAIDFLLTSKLDYLAIDGAIVSRAAASVRRAAADDGAALRHLFVEELPARLKRANGASPRPSARIQVNVNRRVAWLIDVQAGEVEPLETGAVPMVHASLNVDEADWRALFAAPPLSWQQLWERGRLEIVGDAHAALEAARILGFTD
jgi:carbamoyltransferase